MRGLGLAVAGMGMAPNEKAWRSTVHMYELFGLQTLT